MPSVDEGTARREYMDGLRFDTVMRDLSRGASRRRVLGGVLGGVLAALSAGSASAAKNKRRHGDKDDEGDGASSDALVGGIWENTLEICQFDDEGGYNIIDVPMPSVPDYLNKGATVYIDCCVDADCGFLPCAASSGCTEGACMYDATPGVECHAGNGLSGVCNQKGECEAVAPPPPPDTAEPVVTTVEDSFPVE
jgi:hypothetical protein